jgi:hypothetical protein
MRCEGCILADMKSRYLSIALFAPEVQIAANFGFLFSFSLGRDVFSLTSGGVSHPFNPFCLRALGGCLSSLAITSNASFSSLLFADAVAVAQLRFTLEFVSEEAIDTGPIKRAVGKRVQQPRTARFR